MKKLIVKTENGFIEGLHGWDPRIAVFKGVPYAKPPVGELRFRSPQPLENWEGVLQAFDYATVSMQQTPGIDKESFWTKEMHPTGPEYEVSEDCLYMNIFTPARSDKEMLPVLFYIHGGGFTGGYPSEIEFDWEHMARKGMVVVSIQYRLGIFGFLASKALSSVYKEEGKGNYGIEDQIAALKWTRQNIKAFGGDPDRITIAGQSAGAMSVQCLMTSPITKGMIHGAIIESCVEGDFPGLPVFANPMEESERIGDEVMEKGGYHSLEELQAVPAQKLLEQVDTFLGPGFHFRPTIDQRVLMESPFQAYLNDHHPRIPVIAGYNRGETVSFRFEGQKDDDPGMIEATRMFGYIQDSQDRISYLYEFDGDIPGDDNIGSYHGSEMWFAYDSLARSNRPFTGKHYDLARQISSYWTNFVRTGDPNGKETFGNDMPGYGCDLPRWEPFTKEDEFLMLFTDGPSQSPLCTDEKTKKLIEEKTGLKI